MHDESQGYWDEIAAFWDKYVGDEGNEFHRSLVLPATLSLIGDVSGKDLLDLGCGNGHFARWAAHRGAHVVAVDGSPDFIKLARARSGLDLEAVDYRNVDATSRSQLESLGVAVFDVAVANMVLMDLPSISELFLALKTVLRPGGAVVFSVSHPCFNSPYVSHITSVHDDDRGYQTVESAIQVPGYASITRLNTAVPGQPRPTVVFHRTIADLLAPSLSAGFVVTGLREPTLRNVTMVTEGLGSQFVEDIPPLMVIRLRADG